jgi:hypothetical protein
MSPGWILGEREGKAIEDLNTMTRQAELLGNNWKGGLLLNVLATSKMTPSNFNFLNHDFTVLQPSRKEPAV